jgi:hypothetical protein
MAVNFEAECFLHTLLNFGVEIIAFQDFDLHVGQVCVVGHHHYSVLNDAISFKQRYPSPNRGHESLELLWTLLLLFHLPPLISHH